jgi:hypothetical protein
MNVAKFRVGDVVCTYQDESEMELARVIGCETLDDGTFQYHVADADTGVDTIGFYLEHELKPIPGTTNEGTDKTTQAPETGTETNRRLSGRRPDCRRDGTWKEFHVFAVVCNEGAVASSDPVSCQFEV